jgi:hypothetical protein
MGESSLGDSKSDVGGVEVVAITATSLVEVSSSSLSLPEYPYLMAKDSEVSSMIGLKRIYNF